MIKNNGVRVNEASHENIEQRKIDFDITEENTDRLADNTTDAVTEQREELSKCRKLDDVVGQTSVQLKRNPSVAIVRSDHKFTVRSRYRRASVGSCHDLCKVEHKHERKKEEKKSLLGTIRQGERFVRAASVDNLAKSVQEKATKNIAHVQRLYHSGPISGKHVFNRTEGANSPKRITSPRTKMMQVQSERKPSLVQTPGNSFCRSKTEVSGVNKISPVKPSQKVEEIKMVKGKSPSTRATLYKNLLSFSRSKHHNDSEDTSINKSCDVPEIENAKDTGEGLTSSLPTDELPSSKRESRLGKTERSRIKDEDEYRANTTRTKTINRLKEKDSSTWKLNFRKGSVVDLKVANDTAKKLQFNQGRVLGEGQNAEVETRLKNTDVVANELADTKPESEKVLLRRHEASGKNASIDLNSVIEDTVRKLVKTRKSKVKALVGAFETVMSFRHHEPLFKASAS